MEQDKQQQQEQQAQPAEQPMKRTVLDYDDVRKMVPFFDGKPRLVNTLMRWLDIDDVNWIHEHNMDTPGIPFSTGVLKDLNATITIRNEEVLNNLPEGAFVTVSNHPFGGVDGIMMIHMVGTHRSDYRFMVNMILKRLPGMAPSVIPVDPSASTDPEKRAESVKGIAECMRHIKQGHPLGFFPAGAVSRLRPNLRVEDRDWQPTIMRLIQKFKVPVIPIYIHGHNSIISIILGVISWKLRTLRLPAEVFRRKSYDFRVSVGNPIMPETIAQYKTPEELGKYLKQQTYKMKKWQK